MKLWKQIIFIELVMNLIIFLYLQGSPEQSEDNMACNELQLVVDDLQDLCKHLDTFKDYLMDFA